MESENLKRLFLWDLHSNEYTYRFRGLVFYAFVVAGLVFSLLESVFMSGNPVFGYQVLLSWPEVWIYFGAIGALLAFKEERRSLQ